MTDKQMRFNSGKAKLSYVFCNSESINRLLSRRIVSPVVTTSLGPVDLTVCRAAVHECTGFLSRELNSLRNALLCGLSVIELDCGRKLPENFDPLTLQAWDEYCKVCEVGEKKYARGNYRKGAGVTEYLDCGLRHLRARLRGEILDPESGCMHMAHFVWNLWQAMDQPEWRDDRLAAVTRVAPIEVAKTDPPPALSLPQLLAAAETLSGGLPPAPCNGCQTYRNGLASGGNGHCDCTPCCVPGCNPKLPRAESRNPSYVTEAQQEAFRKEF